MKIFKSDGRRVRSWTIKGGMAAALSVALVACGATAAHAEGTWTSSLNQVQPTFSSRDWEDKNLDSKHTIITLSHCQGNAAGKKAGTTAITSVKLTLSSGASVTHACGTYDFGRVGDDTFSFRVTGINGKTKAERKIFLNADVQVSF